MRKLSIALSSIPTYLLLAPAIFAQTPDPVLDAAVRTGKVGNRIITPDTPVGALISFIVAFIIVIAFLAALLYIVIGAFQWITSGGDKQRVADARNHIIAAIIGLIVIALSFVIINVIITALGLGSLTNLKIPTLSEFK